MNEQEMTEHIEILQDSLDEAMEIMLKIRSKIKALKRALQKHRKTILITNDYNENINWFIYFLFSVIHLFTYSISFKN